MRAADVVLTFALVYLESKLGRRLGLLSRYAIPALVTYLGAGGSARAILLDALLISGGESGARWLYYGRDGFARQVFFWEQAKKGLIHAPSRSIQPLYDELNALGMKPSYYGGYIALPAPWIEYDGSVATAWACGYVEHHWRAVSLCCSVGPCCMPMRFGAPDGPKDRGGWYEDVSVQSLTYGTRLNDADQILATLMKTISHMDVGQNISVVEGGDHLRALVRRQIGAGASEAQVDAYITGRGYKMDWAADQIKKGFGSQ